MCLTSPTVALTQLLVLETEPFYKKKKLLQLKKITLKTVTAKLTAHKLLTLNVTQPTLQLKSASREINCN